MKNSKIIIIIIIVIIIGGCIAIYYNTLGKDIFEFKVNWNINIPKGRKSII